MADAFRDDDAFAPEDEFLDSGADFGADPLGDAADIERRILDEDDAPRMNRAAQEDARRPFGARLAEANAVEGDLGDGDDFGDGDAFGDGEEAYEPEPVRGESHAPAPAAPRGVQGEIGADDDELVAPVPRITIHAFCERPETGALVHNAGNDRRLAKAHVTVELGGLSAAIERYHDESTPNLLIVETGMQGRALFEQLEDLAAVCSAETRVVIIGATNDIALYRELMRRGVSEYLVPPMTPLHLIRTVSGLFADPAAPFAGKTIAFIGAKGGVGSSTVAHNVSWCMSEHQRTDAVLVDLDLSYGTAGLDFNQDPAQTISEALQDPDRLDEALLDRLLVRCTERLSLFSAPATLERDWEFSPEAYDSVIDKVRRQAPFVVLDLPHSWNPWVRQTVLAADQVVLTVTPDLACLRNAKNLFDLVRQQRPNDEPPKVVVNMAGCPKRPDIPLKDFSDALGTAPVLVLPFEPELFGKAANNGQMIGEVDHKSRAADGFVHLASLVTGRSNAAASRSRGLFGLFKRRK
ncbi:pilus assembly protein CpaE [Marinicauda algicola]|uniref:Pilus assembly protein CpaE n=1 Tax=Marinicauda algicola TaxID=2029849 RepID=A0A4S2GZR8_9PROT|nr:AAA family ATPase [Marinicauda algicola]TGY88431.1 pilus assembly protein CpaE [Marinicauda algicola]